MMQAGKYYVGDLCYVLRDEDWSDVCKLTIAGDKMLEGEFNLPDGRRFAMFSTAWGDGRYPDREGHYYSVDSGTIGCISFDLITADKYEDITRLGNIVTFDNDFQVYEDQGEIVIGHIHIETSDNDWNEEEEEVFEDWESR